MLGNFWPLIHQLSRLAIYVYVFSVVLQVKLSQRGIASDNTFTFGLWLFAGLLPWLAFTDGFAQSAMAVVKQPNLVKKVVFPLGLLPLVPVLSSFLESLMGIGAVVVLLAVLERTVQPTLLLLPLIWLPQLLLTTGLSYAAASLTVFLRDIPQGIAVTLNLWFFLTPIVYPISRVPEVVRPLVFWLNPLASICEIYRELILFGRVTLWSEWLFMSGMSLVVFAVGLMLFRRLRVAFADVM